MEIGGFFILILVLVVAAVLGGGVYLIAARMRQKKLHPEGDEIEGEPAEPPRPRHLRVENEQHSRFVGTR